MYKNKTHTQRVGFATEAQHPVRCNIRSLTNKTLKHLAWKSKDNLVIHGTTINQHSRVAQLVKWEYVAEASKQKFSEIRSYIGQFLTDAGTIYSMTATSSPVWGALVNVLIKADAAITALDSDTASTAEKVRATIAVIASGICAAFVLVGGLPLKISAALIVMADKVAKLILSIGEKSEQLFDQALLACQDIEGGIAAENTNVVVPRMAVHNASINR